MEVVLVRHYKAGYEIRVEKLTEEEAGGVPGGMVMKSAYTPDGYYIGNGRCAHYLVVKRGIKPEIIPSDGPQAKGRRGHVCSIGFCEAEQKWYGWSHRALYGFGIGDIVDSEDHLCATSGWTDEYLRDHPEADVSLPIGFEAKTLADCKKMAIAFAESVA